MTTMWVTVKVRNPDLAIELLQSFALYLSDENRLEASKEIELLTNQMIVGL